MVRSVEMFLHYLTTGIFFRLATAKSSDFDLNLLVCLIRNTTSETAPSTGWDNMPNDRDISKGADIARMKYYRNEYLAHKPLQQMSNAEFQTACQSVCCVSIRSNFTQKVVFLAIVY